MIEWQGIAADTADVDETSGVSALQLNTRMRIDGELQRRYGMLSTGLPPLDGPILYLASGSGFVVRGTATNVAGDPDPADIPVGPKRKPPIIDVIRPNGGQWAISGFYSFSGGTVSGSCAGTFQTSSNVPFTVTIYRQRNFPPFEKMIIANFTTPAQVGYERYTDVPWNDDFILVGIEIIPTVSTIFFFNGVSLPGCG